MFRYEWLTCYDKLNYGPVKCRDFYNSLEKKKLSRKEYEMSRKEFYKCGCVNMHDWLKEYNIADVNQFIEAVVKAKHQSFSDKLDVLKDAVRIPDILQRYVLNKALKKRPECKLY